MKHTSLLLLLSVCAGACATKGRHIPESVPATRLFGANHAALYEIANPAKARRLPAETDDLRINAAASAGYELGEVDQFINGIDNLQSELRANARRLSLASYIDQYGLDTDAIANAVVADINARAIDVVNRQIALITANSSYVLAHGSIGEPVQVVQHALGGSLEFGMNLTAASNLLAVGDPLKPYTLGELEDRIVQALSSGQPSVNYLLPDTDTAVLVRSAIVDEMSLGYSRPALVHRAGQLVVGIRANYFKVKLARYAKRLRDIASNESTKNLLDDYSDDDARYTGALGLDSAVLWVTPRYRVGAIVNNINQPEFHYNKVDTSAYSGSAVPQQLNADRTWRMNTQLHLEGAVYSVDQQWTLGTSVDGNAAEDPLGHAYQWVSAGAAYTPRYGWFPGLRVGYHANTRGSEIRYLTTGLTLFQAVSLDMTRSLDSVYIERNEAVAFHGRVPRSIMLNLRLELAI